MSSSGPRFASPLRNDDRRGSPPTARNATRTNIPSPGGLASTTRSYSPRPSPPLSATLNDALRNNPFGSTLRARALEAEIKVITASIEDEERRTDLDDKNRSLVVLASLFPDVRVEVFRELLTRFDGESRLQVCVEQLLRHKKHWVQGRWKISDDGKANSISEPKSLIEPGEEAAAAAVVAPEELFRSETYTTAVKVTLCKEFGGLSRSTIEGVLAEVNYSYTCARPTLKELSRKGWRATISNLNPFRRKKNTNKDDHPLIIWERPRDGDVGTPLIPRLRQKTGSPELDHELHESLIVPFLREQKENQEYRDYCLASELNEKEATAEGQLYECQCCLEDVTFEQVVPCSSNQCHMICSSCVRRTLHEAIFGQGWDKSIDAKRSTLKCIAPVSHGVCEGHLPSTLVQRVIVSEKAGLETYRKFEDRLASEALLKSNLRLVCCPFCPYAEIDPIFHPSSSSSITRSDSPHSACGGISWRFRHGNLIYTIFMAILLLDLIPVLILPLLISFLFYPRTITAIFTTSLQNLCLRTRSPRFKCKNPSCRRVTCMTCHRIWQDPHACEEPLQQSLRTTIEAARTAAVKRTCPRCNLSFVKSSGCNKLTCICGYSMCYICRKALNPRPSARTWQPRALPQDGRDRAFFAGGRGDDHRDNDNGNGNGNVAAEVEADGGDDSGYKHFCEHFRVNPGTRCTECNKCELYFSEDEEVIARKAGEQAEREWRLRQSLMMNDNSNSSANLTRSNNNNNNNRNNKSTIDPIDMRSVKLQHRTIATNLPVRWEDHQSQFQRQSIIQQQQQTAADLYRIPAIYNHHNYSWQYWLFEVWKEGRWKWEVQGMADKLAELMIVVDVL